METTRPWQVIADEMTKERDPERMLALAEELNRALAEQQGQEDADGAGQFLIKPASW